MSFNQIAQSDFLLQSLANKYAGKIVPHNNKGISAMMMRFFEEAEAEVIDKIKILKADGKKFSATLDEWTSAASNRKLCGATTTLTP